MYLPLLTWPFESMKYFLTGSDWKLIYAKNEDYLRDGSPVNLDELKAKLLLEVATKAK